jgi:putative membrane protein
VTASGSAATRPPPADTRRFDPRVLATRVLTLSALREQWSLVIPALAVFGLQGGFRLVGVVGAVLLVVLLVIAVALVQWLQAWYAVSDGRLVVHKGVFRRSLTVIPLDRIRGVDVHASAPHRLLRIAVVRVDAAATGGVGDEAVLDAVSREEAERLRAMLLRQAPLAGPPGMGSTVDTAAPAAPAAGTRAVPDEELARMQRRWLLYAPLVGSYLLAPVAAVAAGLQLIEQIPGVRVNEGEEVERAIDALDLGHPLRLALVLAGVVVVTLLGAVATAAVANWGFALRRHGGALVSERGLLSRRQVSLEIARIRGYALAEPLPLRLAGAARLTALVTGLGGESSRRGQLLPLGPATVARQVAAAAVFPFDTPLRAHPPAALRRRLFRATAPGVLVALGFAVFEQWPGVAAGVLLAVLGVPLAIDRYRGLGHARDDRAVSVRSGSLLRRRIVLARGGVVGWQVRQSLFQRRARLATVTVATGAGERAYDIIDAGAADAVAFMREVDPRHVGPLTTLGP